MQHTFLLVFAGAAMAVMVTGCNTGSEMPSPSAPPAATQATTPQPEGAAKELREVKCAPDPKTGEWSLTAKLFNTSDKDSEYTVKASVIKKQGNTVVASRDVTQKVVKGQSADIKMDKFAKPADRPDTLQCVTTTTVKRG